MEDISKTSFYDFLRQFLLFVAKIAEANVMSQRSFYLHQITKTSVSKIQNALFYVKT